MSQTFIRMKSAIIVEMVLKPGTKASEEVPIIREGLLTEIQTHRMSYQRQEIGSERHQQAPSVLKSARGGTNTSNMADRRRV